MVDLNLNPSEYSRLVNAATKKGMNIHAFLRSIIRNLEA